ncbi:ESPR-type extended signal peptide-containing protein [Bisgaard Taxon 46]
MNNIFKTIWNKSTQSWVAVSELARGYVKSSSDKQVSRSGKAGLSKFSLSIIALSVGIAVTSNVLAAISIDQRFNRTDGGSVNNNGGSKHNIAIGHHTRIGDQSSGAKSVNQSIAIGSGNSANDGAWAKGDQSIAIGSNTIAEGDSSIAIGGDDLYKASTVQTDYIDNSGNAQKGSIEKAYTTLTGNSLAATSYQNTISKTLAIAVGVKTKASDLSLALGTFANASATNTVAIGSGAAATLANSIAIGGGAKTDNNNPGTKQSNVTFGKTTFQWAGGESVLAGDIVSFGSKGYERQLKNIAPGAVSENSTDAVNGSQLYSIAKILTEYSERNIYVHVNTGNSSQGTGDPNTNSGQIDEKGGATGTAAATLGLNAKAAGNNSIALGSNSSASQENSVAIGQGSTTSAVSTDNSNLMITFKNENYTKQTVNLTNGLAKTENGSVSFGSAGKERQLHNVAAGRITATSTDAINGSQLYHIAKNLGFNVYQGDSPKARINNDNIVKFSDGDYTTATVTPENGNAKVTFNVKTSTIDANAITVTGNDTGGLAKASEVVNAIKAAGFNVATNGTSTGSDSKIVHNDTLHINQGNGINIAKNNTTFTISLDQTTQDTLAKVGTGRVNAGDDKTVTGATVKTALDNEVTKINQTINDLNLHFEGDVNSNKGKVNLKTGVMKIKGEAGGPISTETSPESDTLTLKINDSSINTKHLADNSIATNKIQDNAVTAGKIQNNAVTEDKIADGNVTFKKLGQDAIDAINAKEEAVEATQAANNLGLTVTPQARDAQKQGKLFSIDLNSATLISKLSDGANITSPTSTSPKLVTDVQVNDYISKSPIGLTADKSNAPTSNNKVGLGGNLSIKGTQGGLITTSVTGSDFTLDLTDDTKNKIAKIGRGAVAKGDTNTVTGEAVYNAIAESSFLLNINNEDNNTGERIKQNSVVKISEGKNISVERNQSTITIKTIDTPTFDSVTINNGPVLDSSGLKMNSKPITGVSSNLTSYTGGSSKDGLLDLSNKTQAPDSDAATVGDLRKMGWVIRSPNSTDNAGAPYTAKVQNANEVEFVGTGLAKVSGKTDANANKHTITVDVQLTDTQGDNKTIKVEGGVIKAVTADIREDQNNPGKVKADDSKPDALATASNVADMINKSGFFVKANGETTTEKISSGGVVDLDASADKNLTIARNAGKFTFSVSKTPTFENISLKPNDTAKAVKLTSDNDGRTLTLGGGENSSAPVKLTNIADGDINENSKDAVSGKQLKDFADTLGVTPNGTSFTKPTFNAIKNKDGNNGVAPNTFKDATDQITTTLNKGLMFAGDSGNGTQYLGSRFDVKSTTTTITEQNNNFIGKNLRTKYTNTNGDGLLSIGLSETPDFKKITLTNDANNQNPQPYLTLEKDNLGTGGKITGLTNRNALDNKNDYGIGENLGRAATEGAVKELSDRVKQADDKSPFIYSDDKGQVLTKANDGKFYPPNLVNADGSPKPEATGQNVPIEKVVVKTKNDVPLPITNVRSGLGLDGKSRDNDADGSPTDPKAISEEKAKNIIAGKDGQSGLLTIKGADLNKVSTIGDLQALAQAGLDFSGNVGQQVHRPLGTKLEILGKEGINSSAGYSGDNLVTETANNKLYIKFKEKPEFKGITVKDGADKQQIELSPDKGLVLKKDDNDDSPVKITATGIDAGDSKITNISDGDISDGSKEAVTGNQLSDLAKKLGVDTNGTSFTAPDFTPIKNKTGADNTKPITFKNVLEQLTTALNNGLTFGGDLGTATKQYLGSTFDVKATTEDITDNGKTFAGKNLKTKYVNSNGDGTLSIGLSEMPDFKKITLTDGGNNATPYLTLEKDLTGDSGKITGLTYRDPTTNVADYGKGDNEGRAATEGAVKELSDRVSQGDKNSPFIYEKVDGTKITKATDGKFYPADKVNSDGTKKDDAVEVPVNEVVVKVNDNTPMPITNVRSGLGLDGKSDTDPAVGSQYEPKAISSDKAKTAIAGTDGKSGLLSKEGKDLNKVSTIGDLQALAQAGLDFAGNKGGTVHRPLGTKLEILGNSTVSEADIATKFSSDNLVTQTVDDKLFIKFKDIPKLKGLELNSGNPNAKTITISPDDTGSKLTLAGESNNGITLDGLKNGEISGSSKNAVTGNQLKDLADKLGVEVNDEKTGFKAPEFTAIKDASGQNAPDANKPNSLKDAVNKTIEAVNRGLTFTGDTGTGTQNLGSTFNVKSTETVITKDNKNFVGKNITTKYVKDDATGNGTLSIGISERPDFKEITLSKDGDSKPFLTIGEDTENTDKPTTGKITGLTARNLDSDKYGIGDNVGRAATEGAVKDLYDKVKSNEGSSPFEYRDSDNNKLVKVGDKYYSEKDLEGKHIVDGKIFDKPVVKDGDKYYEVGPDGKRKLGPDGQPLATDTTTANINAKEPATASNKKLTDISNVASGLGLPGTYTKDPADNGSKENPKPITAEDARKVIAGDTKDGNSGLYTKEGKDLNKVATIGDLQAIAKAGLTFKGNNTDTEVHRPLGTELNIKGEAADATGTSGKNVYVEANANDNSLTVKIKETPEFKGLELKDQNANAIKFTALDVDKKDKSGQKEPVLTLSSGTGPNNTVKLSGISDGDISPNSKDAINGSQVFALTAGKPAPKVQDKYITIVNPDGTTTNIDAKNVIVDESGNPLLKTYNVQGQGEHIQNSVITAINNMNNEGIKFFHTNDGRDESKRPQTQSLNQEDSSAGGSYATAVGYRANAAGTNGIAFGSDAVAGKITGEKEAKITEVVNGKTTTVTRKVRIVEGVNNAIAIGAGALASNDNAVAMGANNQVYSKNSTAIGNNNKIDTASEKTFVLGNNVTVTTARSVFLGDAVGYVAADNKAGTTKGNTEYSEQKIGETTYKYAGGKANEVVGVVSVGNVKQDGTMETRRIQNVAPGLISDKSTDAINGSQLYAVMDSGWNLKAEEVEGTSGKVTKGKTDTTKVSIGKTVKVRAGNNVEIAHNKDESIDISTSMAPTFNSLNVNPGGTVNMGGNRVQNVGNAVEAGDAVNYGQFKAEVGKLDSRLQAGIAGAVASGTLVQAFNPNESLVAVGAGTYRGKSALALGYSRVSDNGKIIIKVTGSTNTYGDVTGGASVGYKF